MDGAWAPTSDPTLGQGSEPALFPGWGCTHSAQFTLSQSGGLSTPGSALLPYGLDVRAGVSLYSIDQLQVDVWQGSTARIATALQYD